jgi:hypothetical protein
MRRQPFNAVSILALLVAVAITNPAASTSSISVHAAAPPDDTGVASVGAERLGATAFRPVEPCRMLDTRSGDVEPLRARDAIEVAVVERCPDARGATATLVTVMVTGTDAGVGELTVWPADQPQPATANVTWTRAGEERVNTAIVGLSATGTVALTATSRTHAILDVVGVFEPSSGTTAGRMVATGAQRLLDTRQRGGPLPPDGVVSVPVPDDVPADAFAVVATLTAIESTRSGQLTVAPAGGTDPPVTALVTDGPGQTRAVTVFAPIGPDGLEVRHHAGGHLVIDLAGFLTGPSAESSAEGLFVLGPPTRVHDTRFEGGTQLYAGGSQAIDSTLVTGPVAAALVNVTMTGSTAPGHVTIFPRGGPLPAVSHVNAEESGQHVSALAVVASGVDGLVVRSAAGTHLTVDVVGWIRGTPSAPTGTPHTIANDPPSPPRLPGPSCAAAPTGRAALVDRVGQRMWLCSDGVAVTGLLPFTAGPIAAAPAGSYRVFFRADPWYGSGYTLRRFVAFTRGVHGGRVAFHQYVAMPESMVGSEAYRNSSHGCFRLRASDSVRVWNFLGYGDRVIVLNNG